MMNVADMIIEHFTCRDIICGIDLFFLPVRQNLFYFSGAGKVYAHGLGQFTCNVKCDVRTLNLRSDVTFAPPPKYRMTFGKGCIVM